VLPDKGTLTLPGQYDVKRIGDLRSLLVSNLFATVLLDKETGYESINRLHDSTFSILMDWSMDRCHNNIFLAEFLSFLKIYFRYSTPATLLNSIIKTNIMSDIEMFFSEFALGWGDISRIMDSYMFFFEGFFDLLASAKSVLFILTPEEKLRGVRHRVGAKF